ncbi:histidine phosphatase family protein [Microbispora sp. CA-135349]|uniref:histidine phosphatase family protein n=1 Tax=Microbispora sp. CA-135349 TaxID=3239953 RepID=UPI003D8C14DE
MNPVNLFSALVRIELLSLRERRSLTGSRPTGRASFDRAPAREESRGGNSRDRARAVISDGVRVWCLRHAESENVTAGLAGAVPAAPLTARGREQAAVAARVLAGEPITGVYCSSSAGRARTGRSPRFAPRPARITAGNLLAGGF